MGVTVGAGVGAGAGAAATVSPVPGRNGSRPKLVVGEEMYLWALVLLELLALILLRTRFRGAHGG